MDKENYGKEQAKSKLEYITELLEIIDSGDALTRREAEEEICESILELLVRSAWHPPGSDDCGPAEYQLLLCTGGPAVRVIGKLDKWGQPETARLQYQDWFIPWTDYELNSAEQEMLVRYAQYFCFEE